MKNKTSLKKIVISIIMFYLLILFCSKTEILNQPVNTNKKLAVNSSLWDTNKVTSYTDSNGDVVPIPKGYVVSGVSGENVVKTGLVIYEGTATVTSAPTSGSSVLSSAQATRNQWVWIPVSDVSRIYEDINGVKRGKLYNYTSTGRSLRTNNNREPGILASYDNEYHFARYNLHRNTKMNFYGDLQVEFESTIKSIQKYGGFYIGRYETGNISKKVPVVRKMNTDIGSQNWYTLANNMQYLVSNSNLKSNMIWGCLWDEMLQWLVDTGCKTYSQIGADSTTWGNYNNATFSYINTSGSTVTKSLNSVVKIPSGSATYTKANNLYDISGNVYDWTLECDTGTKRVLRGGDDGADGNRHPASFINQGVDFDVIREYYGVRAYFYIK